MQIAILMSMSALQCLAINLPGESVGVVETMEAHQGKARSGFAVLLLTFLLDLH